MSAGGQGRDLDLRLALPALAAWLTAWLTRGVEPKWLLVGAALAGSLAVVLLLPGRSRPLVAAALICAAAAGLAVAGRSQVRSTSAVAELARTGSAAVLEVVVTGDPRRVVSGGRDLVVIDARAEQVDAAGRSTRLRVPVLVLSTDPLWQDLLPSQRVRVEGRLRPTDRGDDTAALLSARGPPLVLTRPTAVQRVAGHLRAGLRRAVEPLPAAEQGLLPGLVVGDVSGLDPQLREDFRSTGLSHLVAVSGTNVAIVLGAVLLLSRGLGLGLVAAPLLSVAALAAFVVLARPSPSVLRAAVMGLVGLAALVSGSRRSALPALSAAVLLLVLIDPGLASSPGFALSVLATAGLLLLAPAWTLALNRHLPLWLAAAIAVPAAAQVFCGPVVVAISGSLGAMSVPANLLAVPAVAPATLAGVAAALVAPVSLPAAQALAWLAYLPTAWLVRVARTGASVPGADLGWPSGTTGGLLLAGASVMVLAALARRGPRRALAAGVAGALLTLVGLRVTGPAWPPADWVLAVCDVGQGDALALRSGDGQAVVVDAGPDPRAVDRCLRRLGVRAVPVLLLTHLHADHVDGLPGVLRRPVGRVEIGPLDEPAGQVAAVRRQAAAKGVGVERATLGQVRRLAGLRWELLAPLRPYVGTDSDPNNASLVLRVEVAGLVLLLTGDVEPEAQADLLATGRDVRADVLKVPHHGSAHQLPAFLEAVHPRVAVTSVGAENTYGHPSAATLGLLTARGAQSFRTDRDGDIAVAGKADALRVVPSASRDVEGRAPSRAGPQTPLQEAPLPWRPAAVADRVQAARGRGIMGRARRADPHVDARGRRRGVARLPGRRRHGRRGARAPPRGRGH